MNIIFCNSLLLNKLFTGHNLVRFSGLLASHALRFHYTNVNKNNFLSIIPAITAAALGLDIRLVTANVLLELEQLRRKLDLVLQEVLGIKIVLGGVVGVLLNVQADGGAGRASARETDNDAAAGGEAGVQALVGGDGAVQVGVGEVAGLGDGALCSQRHVR